jgi:hypothetical protein|tara:strand:+ start:65 stop:385 length:321 start_codon:yes stop_codon:yes gene_type:complete
MGRYLTSTLNYATTNVVTGVSVTAVANNRVICTAGSITVTLPATAVSGDTVQIIDVGGNAGSANITVARNGHEIQNAADNLVIDINNAAPILVYTGVTYGWVIAGS